MPPRLYGYIFEVILMIHSFMTHYVTACVTRVVGAMSSEILGRTRYYTYHKPLEVAIEYFQ